MLRSGYVALLVFEEKKKLLPDGRAKLEGVAATAKSPTKAGDAFEEKSKSSLPYCGHAQHEGVTERHAGNEGAQ